MSLRSAFREAEKPIIAITVGDVAGIGPELSLRCIASSTVLDRCVPVLIGPHDALKKIGGVVGATVPDVSSAKTPNRESAPTLIDIGSVNADTLQPGVFSAQTGQASFEAVQFAIEQTMRGRFDAIVTGPIQKEAWHLAGAPYLGHTELLADRTMTADYCMMLSGPTCSTVLVTIHLPLLDAVKSLSTEAIERAIRLGGMAMESRLRRPPRIMVLGLNPHAGESGLLSHGDEEQLIIPAIE
ncbi:MAG: 4-hydroxythreonine-4-phosphate dehydrogenase PdxA, partial [Planctomycetota bacterium]